MTAHRTIGFMTAALLLPSIGRAQLTDSQKAEIIDSALMQLSATYVFPEVGERMDEHVRQRAAEGAYEAITDLAEFGRVLTEDLRSVSQDRHLAVYVPRPRPSQPAGRAQSGNSPGQIVSSQVLEGNIGYLRIGTFAGPAQIGADIDAAMAALAGTDALLIDLRDNGGGSPATVMLLAGYLIPERTLVARIYSRPTNQYTEMWTTPANDHHYSRDVYILTSNRTFSAAEAAAYHLKHLGRATTVGENTGGGAHRISRATLPHGLSISLPYTRPINVVTESDWEGTGVIADIPAASENALSTAHVTALRALPANANREALIQRLEG